jgi:DNA polymerase-1
LVEQAENARLSRRLATIETRAPVEFHPDQYQLKPADQERFADLLRELEFTTLLKNLQASAKPPEDRRLAATIVIEDEASALRFVSALPQNAPLGIQCLLGGGSGIQAQLLGLALSDGENTVFVPFDPQAVMPSITALLHDAQRPKVVHDLKSTLLSFQQAGLVLRGPCIDTMIADYLLNPNRRDHQLETIALRSREYGFSVGRRRLRSHCSKSIPAHGKMPQKGPSLWPAWPRDEPTPVGTGSLTLFNEVEIPLVPVLVEIERNGFLLDVDRLHALGKELEREMDRTMERIAGLAGGEFNINSPDSSRPSCLKNSV